MLPLYNCPFRQATGLLCPGCGMTHALISLAKGDWAAAAAHNALVFVLPVVLLAVLWRRVWLTYSVLGFVLAFAIARNFRPDWLGIG